MVDLNIIVSNCSVKTDVSVVKRMIERAYEYGFSCIALNTIIDKNNLSGKNICVPEPTTVDFEVNGSRKFRVMTRLTAIIEDGIHAHHLMKSKTTKNYDLLAVQPVGEKMLQHVCLHLDCDIVCLDLTQQLGYTLKRNQVGVAKQKGAFFEISYAPCLSSQSVRRMVLSNALLLVSVTKGRNVIVSSGATRSLLLRSPDDIANLALLFGFSKESAIDAVRGNAKLVLDHAATRNKTGCGFVSITGLHRLPKYQGWIVKACKAPKMSDEDASSTTKKSEEAVTEGEESVKKKVRKE